MMCSAARVNAVSALATPRAMSYHRLHTDSEMHIKDKAAVRSGGRSYFEDRLQWTRLR